MVEEAGGRWRVVGLDDGVFDGILKVGDGFALMADFEAMVLGGNGGCDESSDRDRVWDGPVVVGDFNGVVFGDVTDVRCV